jgi:MYXO-CTERM domain-containing protein
MRLDGTPLAQQGDLKPFAWGCEVDTDANLDAYEFLTIVDGIAGKDATLWYRNSTPSTGSTTNDIAERLLIEYPGASHWRVVTAGANFPVAPGVPNEDFFLDWALALADLANPPQAVPPLAAADIIDLSKPLTIVCGTSANKQALTKDFVGAGTTLSELAPDPVTCDSDCHGEITGDGGPNDAGGDAAATGGSGGIGGSADAGATIDSSASGGASGGAAGKVGSGGSKADEGDLGLEGGGCACAMRDTDAEGGLGLTLGALAWVALRRRRRHE